MASTAPQAAMLPDDLNLMGDDDFRLMLREWIAANYPPHKRYVSGRLTFDQISDWFMALSRKGWLAPQWPREYGGMGLSPGKYLIYVEEMARHGCARIPDHGIGLIGPLLIEFGTAEQKAEYLPKILTGEHIWCQGYSEPNAGSDLASLRTEAVLDGDSFIVNGQKIWTTLAHSAHWIFALVRTDKTAKSRQAGISMLLINLSTPGVRVRTIRNIKGEREFCEVFFDNVRVPAKNLVGEINEGWTLAKSVLGHERILLGSPRAPELALVRLQSLARHLGVQDDPVYLSRYAQLRTDAYDLRSAYEMYADMVRAGKEIGADVSYLKIWTTTLFQRVTEEMVRVGGDLSRLADDLRFGDENIDLMALFLESRAPAIYGGSNEIQRNILAKAVLRLPG